jgi:hypothetical protein
VVADLIAEADSRVDALFTCAGADTLIIVVDALMAEVWAVSTAFEDCSGCSDGSGMSSFDGFGSGRPSGSCVG